MRQQINIVTLLASGSVSGSRAAIKMTSMTDKKTANRAGAMKNASPLVRSICEKPAPISGPKMKPTENAAPTKAYKTQNCKL